MPCSQRFTPRPEFPVREVITLAFCVTTNFYTLVNLFPYVGVMVRDMMELDSINEAGFYAGYVASAFTFGRLVSGYVLGYVSDKVGRKPVIIAGLSSIIIFSLAFGLSPNFAWAASSRLLLGLTNGTMAASRTSLREVCGPQHVVIGMTYLAGSRSVALVLGTCVGGLLVTPALHYPEVFSSTGIFARYPFLLPNLVGAAFAFIALPMVIFWLPETIHVDSPGEGELSRLEGEVGQEDSAGSQYTSSGASSVEDPAATPTHAKDELGEIIRREDPRMCGPTGFLRRPLIHAVLFLGCITQTVRLGFDEVLPLWMLSTPDVGGLGWDTKGIGLVLLITGVLMGVLQLGIFPSLIKIIGMVKWSRAGGILCVGSLIMVPNAKALSWNSPSLFIACVASNLLVNCSLSALGIALMITSTNIVPPDQRGTFSGLYNTSESLGRFLGPAGYAMTYALSISHNAERWIWMDPHFVFYVSAIIMVVVSLLGWWTLTIDVFSGRVERVEGSDSQGEVISAFDRVAANDESDTYLKNSPEDHRKPTACS